ncbi:acyltransferase [Orrella sp. JC864]|uniref:acyltransferase n=1 Tax=Orrella sp. JC864 TaxID=3120298 RepID=UPI003FA7DDA2
MARSAAQAACSTDPRLARLDAARWIAALAVVLLHCAAVPVSGSEPYGSPGWVSANLYDSAVRWCVPVFVMISGALLLAPARREGLPRFYMRRTARILLPLAFWTLFYLGWSALLERLDGTPTDPWAWLTRLSEGRPYYHLWYLYMIVGLYLFAPFVRDMYGRLNERRRLACVLGTLGIAVMDALYRHWAGTGYGFFLAWFVPYLGYFIAGRMVFEGSLRLPRPGLVLALSVAATAAGVYALSNAQAMNFYFYDYFSVTVPFMSLAAFQLILSQSRLPRLTLLAPLTFGVYLIHPVFIDLAQRSDLYEGPMPPAWSLPLVAVAIFVMSAACIWVFQRLPVLRRVV